MSPHDPSDYGSFEPGRLVIPTVAHRVHDLKNQLTIMAGCVDSLSGQLSALRPLSDLADLQRALGRAFLLAADLLGADSALATRSAIDINQAIRDAEPTLRRLTAPIRLTLNLRATTPLVVAHPLDLERILVNLILNARDALKPGGHLTIETAPAATPFVRLTVGDTGRGIPADDQTRLLRETAFTTKTHGHGLGLGSVNEVVQQLAGRVHLESREGVGTRVHVDLPLAGGSLEAQP